MKFPSGLALAFLSALAAIHPAHADKGPAAVTNERLAQANADTDNWLSYGRTHDEQRFSPLDQIDSSNVAKLGLVWFADMDTARGQEATPLVVDGALYVSTAWSMVKVYDAATSKPLWQYDPQVPRETLVKLCCDAVNRGVAVYEGKVIVATLDGRLVALDAATGKEVWVTRTFPEDSDYTITGAPRIVKGRVVIGSSGSEYNARGFISAYDASSGKQVWRFHTVPGNPADGFENEAMAAAAKTWTGEWWKVGGGGTVWDSISYEPALNLIYFGTGNAEPWLGSARSPNGEDNLYTSSIVAIDADTGVYKWHFQETPQDRWDFDSNQQIIFATLKLGSKDRRVLLHAPKNGFFYVLDAATGEFVSGEAFTGMNWASGLDAKGRPIYEPAAFYDKTGEAFISVPGAAGAHSWQPMSFSPKTGLVYIPVNLAGWPYAAAKDWKQTKLGFQTGMDAARLAMPADAKVQAEYMAQTTGELLAWDPVAQKAGWRVPHPGPWNGGTLATAGNLVFQGTAGGSFNAYAADTGTRLWSTPTQTGVIAAPMTYAVAGEHYVAILAGWGGVWDLVGSVLARKSGSARNISRLLVFKLGAAQQLPPLAPMAKRVLDPPPVSGTPEQIAAGANSYGRYCTVCHGDAAVAGGLTPDLRHSGLINTPEGFRAIVIDGALQHRGMVSFQTEVTPAMADEIRLYVIQRANEDKALERAMSEGNMGAQ
jgi:alcohol dehydrogenase (cytochrome c)/quinohemoprotein ethanol dehydrogenase